MLLYHLYVLPLSDVPDLSILVPPRHIFDFKLVFLFFQPCLLANGHQLLDGLHLGLLQLLLLNLEFSILSFLVLVQPHEVKRMLGLCLLDFVIGLELLHDVVHIHVLVMLRQVGHLFKLSGNW